MKRALLGLLVTVVALQAAVAAINWNMTKDWDQYREKETQ